MIKLRQKQTTLNSDISTKYNEYYRAIMDNITTKFIENAQAS